MTWRPTPGPSRSAPFFPRSRLHRSNRRPTPRAAPPPIRHPGPRLDPQTRALPTLQRRPPVVNPRLQTRSLFLLGAARKPRLFRVSRKHVHVVGEAVQVGHDIAPLQLSGRGRASRLSAPLCARPCALRPKQQPAPSHPERRTQSACHGVRISRRCGSRRQRPSTQRPGSHLRPACPGWPHR